MTNLKEKTKEKKENPKHLESPEDKIPGYTTFLQNENRFRLDSEYINHWKEKNKNIETKESLDIPSSFTEEDLLKEIKSLKEDLASAEAPEEIEYLEEQAKSQKTKLAENQKIIEDLEKTRFELTKNITELSRANDAAYLISIDLSNWLLKYGEHTEECDYIDLICSGRVPTKKESEICSCGLLTSKGNAEFLLTEHDKTTKNKT